MDGSGLIDYYNIPHTCKKCNGVMIFKGVGEYKCEDCGYLDYDDYGKVRNYIEQHKGATALEIENAIGVSQRTIRQLLRDNRIEVASDSRIFMHCEICGKSLRSGKYCAECEQKVHRRLEEQTRAEKQKMKSRRDMQGYSTHVDKDDGRMRYLQDI